jgi:hypothetical protein
METEKLIIKRAKSVKNLEDEKHASFKFDGIWGQVIKETETNGAWLIYGKEKNGKTWFALMLAKYLSEKFGKVLYVSAEEGTGLNFKNSYKRAGISHKNSHITFIDYEPMEVLKMRLKRNKQPKIIFIDNLTIYAKEFTKKDLTRLIKEELPNCLFVFLAHEKRGEPYTATAEGCRILAKVIMHVQGLACLVSGRIDPGGYIAINEEKACLYHGQHILNNQTTADNGHT